MLGTYEQGARVLYQLVNKAKPAAGESMLLAELESAYRRGYQDAQRDIRQALGVEDRLAELEYEMTHE